jgi:hypothetical protein
MQLLFEVVTVFQCLLLQSVYPNHDTKYRAWIKSNLLLDCYLVALDVAAEVREILLLVIVLIDA